MIINTLHNLTCPTAQRDIYTKQTRDEVPPGWLFKLNTKNIKISRRPELGRAGHIIETYFGRRE